MYNSGHMTLTKEQRHLYHIQHKEYYNKKSKEWNKTHPEKCRESCKKAYWKLRLEVFSHYGGNPPKCACCNETKIKFLTIDHINGGGYKHRKETGLYADKLYRWLRKNNYPEGYQILCWNCNMGRAHNNGVCPHRGMVYD